MKGILDRFEGDQAVILIEEQHIEVLMEQSVLPTGSDINTVFEMEKSDGAFKILSIDASKTKIDAQKSSDLIAKLRSKSNGSKFRKK